MYARRCTIISAQASLHDSVAAAPPPLEDEGYRMAVQASLQERYMQARQRQASDSSRAPVEEDDPVLRAAIAASLAEQQPSGLYPAVAPGGASAPPP